MVTHHHFNRASLRTSTWSLVCSRYKYTPSRQRPPFVVSAVPGDHLGAGCYAILHENSHPLPQQVVDFKGYAPVSGQGVPYGRRAVEWIGIVLRQPIRLRKR